LKEVDDDVEDDASKVYMEVEFDDAYLSTEKKKFLLFYTPKRNVHYFYLIVFSGCLYDELERK